MSIGEIVLIALIVVNVLAFLSAVWVAYLDWKKDGQWSWTYPLEGLFIIPLCILLAFGWPIVKLRYYR